MHISLDSKAKIKGYYDSPWPAECGGPRRQKIPRSPGLNIKEGEHLSQKTRENGEWNVMMVLRDPGEVFLMGNNHINSVEKYGFLEKIDPYSLECISRSPNLPSGGHTWCGGVVVHENGYLYLNNGNYCYKLDSDCHVIASKKLPQNSAYNSFLIMKDGNLVMKNIEHASDAKSKFVILEPEFLNQVADEVTIDENSMGRIAMDIDSEGTQWVYVPGRDTFFRYKYEEANLTLDQSWMPRYRTLNYEEQSFSWDSCISDGGCWFLDNGDNRANVTIFSTRPFGQNLPPRGSVFQGLSSSPQKLFRADIKKGQKLEVVQPFDKQRGSIFSPPAFDPIHKIAIAFDTGNGLLAGLSYSKDVGFKKLWEKPTRISMQMVMFSDTKEIAVNDFRTGCDNVVIIDTITGEEKGRVPTESTTANGMFLSPGWERDVFYCSIGAIARAFIE